MCASKNEVYCTVGQYSYSVLNSPWLPSGQAEGIYVAAPNDRECNATVRL
jgi:hypothetical protein